MAFIVSPNNNNDDNNGKTLHLIYFAALPHTILHFIVNKPFINVSHC